MNKQWILIVSLCIGLQTINTLCSEQNNNKWCCVFKRNPYKEICYDYDSCANHPRSVVSYVGGGTSGITGLAASVCFCANMGSDRYSTCGQALRHTCFPTDCTRTSESCCTTISWINTLLLFTSITVATCAWNPFCDGQGCNVGCNKKEKNPLKSEPIEMN